MKTAQVELESVSPYSQSKHYSKDDVPKINKGNETDRDYEARTWKNRLHVDKDGQVFIPPTAFKNCLSEAAKYLNVQIPGKGKATYTKHFEAGVLVVEPMPLGIAADKIDGEWLFVPASGKRGDGKRVTKCFPIIHQWKGSVQFLILDETITKDVFEQVLTGAGQFIGIGRFRPRNNGFYGRFKINKLNWE